MADDLKIQPADIPHEAILPMPMGDAVCAMPAIAYLVKSFPWFKAKCIVAPDFLRDFTEALFAEDPRFAQPQLVAFDWAPPALAAAKLAKGTEVAYPVQDFYLTNPIARSSPTLQRCSAEILHGQDYAEAAE